MIDVKNDTLHNDVISINQNINISGLTLLSLWDTIGNPTTYRVVWPEDRLLPLRDNTVVAVYSRKGHGQIHLKSNKIISLNGQCVVFLSPNEIEQYFCCDLIWELNWMEFISTGVSNFPMSQVIILNDLDMNSQVDNAIKNLKNEDQKRQRLGVAIINKLIYEWLIYSESFVKLDLELEKVQRVIAKIHLDINNKWTTKMLSEIINCSESHLRKLFLQYIGKSPKEYVINAKLEYAYASLANNLSTISQVSSELGFYDSFHFSKAFKSRFGFPPSQCHVDKE